ncbi:LacI family DNA-binding transcriptional regulator [Streptomyces purpurogeneiscleroticus]|uniref:LacI family DNA-binding transcriptional regulator n=1 Tax=Streptomyces purpurogeneiscleroticus TaxID=68259 RepID=UPI0027DFDF97|nr:LacI family DNA-binding transcriptional regulator [Streptomyces purpurogeneiscleroticus]
MPPAQRHPTMADVAERAGVSASTVSRTLRGMSTVSPEVRARVEKAARELNFVISRQASSLVTGKTGVVAVLAPTLNSWFIGSALSSLGPLLRAAGMELLVYVTPDMTERAAFFERLPARRNADALMVFSFNLTDEETARLDDLQMPVIYVSQRAECRPSVYVDDVAGALGGTRHLLNLGHRRIGFVQTIGASGFTFSSHERLLGYQQALTEAGIPLDNDLVVATPVGHKRRTAEAVGRLLSLGEPPTAIFAEQDEVAVSVLWTLRRARIDVPERISVLGFDDHQMAEWSDLTTIAQSPEEIGRAAGELARDLINNPEADQARHIVLPTRLMPRATTAPPPADPDHASQQPSS